MNKTLLIGRLTKDPIQGNNNCKFTVAVNRMKEGADFINCVAFGKTGDTIAQYLTKGNPIAIEGHIQTGSYQKGDQTIYTTDVIVDRIEFVGGGQAAQTSKKSLDEHLKDTMGDSLEVDDGDIPF